jgi:hypothetical protein
MKINICDKTNTNENTFETIISVLRDEAQEWANFSTEPTLGTKPKVQNQLPNRSNFHDHMEKYFSNLKCKDTNLLKMLCLCYTYNPTRFIHTFVHWAKQLDTSKEEKKSWLHPLHHRGWKHNYYTTRGPLLKNNYSIYSSEALKF